MTPTNHDDRLTAAVLPNLDAAYRLAQWHLGNKRAAEDVVYEAARRTVQESEKSSPDRARASFLRTVRCVCSEWRGSLADAKDAPVPADVASPIDEAIRSLPSRQREVLVLRELEGLSYAEVADVLGVSIDTVTARLSQSRRALSRVLEGQSAAV